MHKHHANTFLLLLANNLYDPLSEGVVPGKPLNLEVTEATKNYVVLSWKPPGERGHEGIMYYVEKVSHNLLTEPLLWCPGNPSAFLVPCPSWEVLAGAVVV